MSHSVMPEVGVMPIGNIWLGLSDARAFMLSAPGSATQSSPVTLIRGRRWHIVAQKCQTALGFFVNCSFDNMTYDQDSTCHVDVIMRLRDQRNRQHRVRHVQHIFRPTSSQAGIANFVTFHDLFVENNGFIKDDRIVFEVDLISSVPTSLPASLLSLKLPSPNTLDPLNRPNDQLNSQRIFEKLIAQIHSTTPTDSKTFVAPGPSKVRNMINQLCSLNDNRSNFERQPNRSSVENKTEPVQNDRASSDIMDATVTSINDSRKIDSINKKIPSELQGEFPYECRSDKETVSAAVANVQYDMKEMRDDIKSLYDIVSSMKEEKTAQKVAKQSQEDQFKKLREDVDDLQNEIRLLKANIACQSLLKRNESQRYDNKENTPKFDTMAGIARLTEKFSILQCELRTADARWQSELKSVQNDKRTTCRIRCEHADS